MTIRTVAASALLAVLPVAAVACSGEDSASTSTTTTTTTAVRNFAVATPQGQVSLSLDGKLPPGWPEDFPVPRSAEPAGSGSLGGTDSTVRVAVYTTTGSGQDTLDFYVDNPDLQVGPPSGAGSGQGFVGSADLLSPFAGGVTVLSRDGEGYLVVTLTEGDGGSDSTATSATSG
jgi:hypothetical protein